LPLVACGGGLVVPPGMLELLRARGVVICLHAPIETILQRTMHTTTRPLLQVDDRRKAPARALRPAGGIYRRTGRW